MPIRNNKFFSYIIRRLSPSVFTSIIVIFALMITSCAAEENDSTNHRISGEAASTLSDLPDPYKAPEPKDQVDTNQCPYKFESDGSGPSSCSWLLSIFALGYSADDRWILKKDNSVVAFVGESPTYDRNWEPYNPQKLIDSATTWWTNQQKTGNNEVRIYPDILSRFLEYLSIHYDTTDPSKSISERGWEGLTLGAIVQLERHRLQWVRFQTNDDFDPSSFIIVPEQDASTKSTMTTNNSHAITVTNRYYPDPNSPYKPPKNREHIKWYWQLSASCIDDLSHNLSDTEIDSLTKYLQIHAIITKHEGPDAIGPDAITLLRNVLFEYRPIDQEFDLSIILKGSMVEKTIDTSSATSFRDSWKKAMFLASSNDYGTFIRDVLPTIGAALDRANDQGRYLQSDFSYFDGKNASSIVKDELPSSNFSFGTSFGSQSITGGMTLATVSIYSGLGRYSDFDAIRPGIELHGSQALQDPTSQLSAQNYVGAQLLLPTSGRLTFYFHPLVNADPSERMLESSGPRGGDILKSYYSGTYDNNMLFYNQIAFGGKVIEVKNYAASGQPSIDQNVLAGDIYYVLGVSGGFWGPDTGSAGASKKFGWLDANAFLNFSFIGKDSLSAPLGIPQGQQFLHSAFIPSAGGQLQLTIKSTATVSGIFSTPWRRSDRNSFGNEVWSLAATVDF